MGNNDSINVEPTEKLEVKSEAPDYAKISTPMQQPPVVKEATSDQDLVKDIESSKIMKEKIETTEPPKDQTETKTADFEPKINTEPDYQNQELKPETVTMNSQENIEEPTENLVDPGIYKSDQDQTSSDTSNSEIE